MAVDYSRFEGIGKEEEKKKDEELGCDNDGGKSVSPALATSIKVAKQEGYGDRFNANSWHFEERDYSAWGKKRLNELLDKVDTSASGIPFTHESQDFSLELKTEMKKLEGDAWCNIRKGKKLTCFNYEMELAFKGHVVGGTSNKWELEGKVFYEVAVDDDPESRFEFKQRYPFQRRMEATLCQFVTAKVAVMVKELSEKGNFNKESRKGLDAGAQAQVQVGQYKKFQEGPDGVQLLQETAKKYSEEMNSKTKESSSKASKHLHCDKLTH